MTHEPAGRAFPSARTTEAGRHGTTRRALGAAAVAVLVLAALVSCSSGSSVPEGTPRCDLGRGNDQDIIGHDSAASTELPDGRVLFVFGDTLIGSISHGRRHVRALANSSSAILPAGSGICDGSLRYRTYKTGFPVELLPRSKKPNVALWPVDVTVLRGKVWLLYRMVERKGSQAALFEFHTLGTGLASADPNTAQFTAEPKLLVKGDHVMPSALAGDQRAGILRTLVCGPNGKEPCKPAQVQLAHDGPRLRYQRSDGTLTPHRSQAPDVVGFASTAMSLTRRDVDGREVWRSSATDGLSCKLKVATAVRVAGDWEDRTVLHPDPGKDHLCYAGRVQEAFSTDQRLTVTWVDTGVTSSAVRDDADLYWPHVETVPR